MFENLSSKQLARAAAIKERIESLQSELDQVLGSSSAGSSTLETSTAASGQGRGHGKGKGPISAAGLARIKAAQKARWAKFHKEKGTSTKGTNGTAAAASGGSKPKRTMSPAARARIAAAAKARWAKFRKEKGT